MGQALRRRRGGGVHGQHRQPSMAAPMPPVPGKALHLLFPLMLTPTWARLCPPGGSSTMRNSPFWGVLQWAILPVCSCEMA